MGPAPAVAAAVAAVRSLVGQAVVVIEKDIVIVVVESIAAGVAGQAVESTVDCLEVVSDVEAENTADKGAPT